MRPGETVHAGASNTCLDCGAAIEGPTVCMSAAGYFGGYQCPKCGVMHSRETGYFRTEQLAQIAIDHGAWRT